MSYTEPPQEDPQADIVEVINQLELLVSEGKRVPFSNRIMVEEDYFLNLVELLRETVPAEIRQAQRVVKERERIIGEAQTEASKILETARERAEYFASREGIYNEAKLRAEDVLRKAEEERRRALGEIELYAMEQLNRVEVAIREGFGVIQNAMRESVEIIDSALDSARGRGDTYD